MISYLFVINMINKYTACSLCISCCKLWVDGFGGQACSFLFFPSTENKKKKQTNKQNQNKYKQQQTNNNNKYQQKQNKNKTKTIIQINKN